MGKSLELQGGEIFAIPLFISDVPSHKSFSRNKFEDRGKEFAFCRIIDNKKGSGYLVEVFDLVGDLKQDLESIITSQRLFKPVAITAMGITKKRWKKVHVQENFNKETDSKASEIQLVLGTSDNFRLWQDGKETPISEEEAKNYEMWKVWMPAQLEKRIIEELSK